MRQVCARGEKTDIVQLAQAPDERLLGYQVVRSQVVRFDTCSREQIRRETYQSILEIQRMNYLYRKKNEDVLV